jgi:hypothetical protein
MHAKELAELKEIEAFLSVLIETEPELIRQVTLLIKLVNITFIEHYSHIYLGGT